MVNALWILRNFTILIFQTFVLQNIYVILKLLIMLPAFLGLNGPCIKDSGRLFPFQVANDDEGLTIEKCKKLCFEDHGYVYAGVQYAHQCFCGNRRPSISPAPQSDCSKPCSGDSSQKCGGTWRMNIYRNLRQSKPNLSFQVATDCFMV